MYHPDGNCLQYIGHGERYFTDLPLTNSTYFLLCRHVHFADATQNNKARQ